MAFAGFCHKALPFFKALAFHQSREWFEANRETYESAIKGPMGELVEDVAERLGQAKIPIKGDRKASLFRIYRDVRFSANKDPYKTSSGAVLTRWGVRTIPGSSTSTCRRRSASLRPAPEAAIASPALVDDFCAFARDALPLLKWGWDALADSRLRPPA